MPTSCPFRSVVSRSPRAALLLVALSAVACGGDVGRWGEGADADHRPAEPHLELAIGEGLEEPREYQFSGIRAIEVGRDGTIWVLDGEGPTALLRQFDAEGRFLRTVGGVGEGPGEYLAPLALAVLPDGRVALRDGRALDRITLYASDGTLDGTWRISGWSDRGGAASPLVVADTGAVLWMRFQGPRRPTDPRHPRPPPVFVRARADGTFLDTVPWPTLPQVPRDSLRVVDTSASGSVGVSVPYQPWGRAVLGPAGTFAVYRTDRYRVEILPPVPRGAPPDLSGSLAPEVVISRDVPPVPVSEAERRALRATMKADLKRTLERMGGGSGPAVPEVPRHKPPLKSVLFGQDRRVWVSVSIPSVRKAGQWLDPQAYDVFEPDGTFLGRVRLPDGFSVQAARGDHVWGVLRGELDVASVRRYWIRWQ